MEPDGIQLDNLELQMLRLNKQSAYNYRYRRHLDWDENYELYRDKVTINRLTQRQSVNIPIMKQTVRSLLKDVDDMPVLYFENLDNDKEAELFKNEYWKWTVEQNKMDLQDIVDKRQVFLFGRSFDQWQIIDGKVVMTVQDPMDILVDRYTDPFNLHSARFLIHTHIFKPLSTLKNNPDYDQEAVKRLEQFYATKLGLIKSKTNMQLLEEKNRKMADMGVLDAYDPLLGETYVELSLHFVYRDNEVDENNNKIEPQIFMYVEVDDMEILLRKPLEKVIGVTQDHFWRTHYPYNSWGDDLERQDFWSDSIGDIVRGTNKVVNTWYSQEVENRTLASLGMHYFDNTIEGFNPQTYPVKAFGWYGVPGKPQDIMQKVDIQPLAGNLDAMEFAIGVNEKATGATPAQQGAQAERQITLGEVQLDLGEAKERIKGMSKFYTPAWKDRGMMFIKLIEAAPEKLDVVKIYKKGKNTSNMYSREIGPDDWMTKSGYTCRVWSQDEKDAQDTQQLQRIVAVSADMADNPKMQEIKKRKELEFAGLTPEEINEVMQFEQQKQEALMSMVGNGVEMPGMPAEQNGAPNNAQAKPVAPKPPMINQLVQQ